MVYTCCDDTHRDDTHRDTHYPTRGRGTPPQSLEVVRTELALQMVGLRLYLVPRRS